MQQAVFNFSEFDNFPFGIGGGLFINIEGDAGVL